MGNRGERIIFALGKSFNALDTAQQHLHSMDDNKGKISVVINTYNAEKHLDRVLKAVKGFDEVVVCDMESTDDTLEIAKRHGCRIVTFEKKDYVSAEPARTFAIQSASCEWVLVVDADELVTPQLRDYLYAAINSPDCPRGLYLPRKNFFMGRFMHSRYPDYILRFFVKEGTVWPPYVHTLPIVKGTTEYIDKRNKDLALIHLADDSIQTVVAKTNLYTENEIKKKTGKRYGVTALLWRPFFRFFKAYVLKGGFRDGKEGFICACYDGFYQFVAVSKILESQKHRKE